ncbi:MAG: LEPR-XLL domain-containing protein, partial [Alphaproteobacteria bacterium]|nr:LEPR-XLL domain-containing protein [Alphaproteobacteria bacterium]
MADGSGGRSAGRGMRLGRGRRPYRLETLEPRVLLSADPLGLAALESAATDVDGTVLRVELTGPGTASFSDDGSGPRLRLDGTTSETSA